MQLFLMLLQIVLMLLAAPLLSGIITKIKNNLRMRKGPSILQPYYNLAKYFRKDEVVSEHVSWIFRAAPYIVFSSTIVAAMLTPFFFQLTAPQYVGDFLALIFLFSLGRFFLSLAGLDPASAFGGMGSSREMFISSFVEPVILLSVLGVAYGAGTTSLLVISSLQPVLLSPLFAILALFLVTLAETSRIPIDNQETHLELTMIHEAMVLEYSGRSLALLEWAAYLKQLIFFSLIAFLINTYLGMQPAAILLELLGLCLVVSLTELSLAKMRLFRAVDYLAFAGVLGLFALVGIILGV